MLVLIMCEMHERLMRLCVCVTGSPDSSGTGHGHVLARNDARNWKWLDSDELYQYKIQLFVIKSDAERRTEITCRRLSCTTELRSHDREERQ